MVFNSDGFLDRHNQTRYSTEYDMRRYEFDLWGRREEERLESWRYANAITLRTKNYTRYVIFVLFSCFPFCCFICNLLNMNPTGGDMRWGDEERDIKKRKDKRERYEIRKIE